MSRNQTDSLMICATNHFLKSLHEMSESTKTLETLNLDFFYSKICLNSVTNKYECKLRQMTAVMCV